MGKRIIHFPLLCYFLFDIPMPPAFLTAGLKDRVCVLPFGIEGALPHGLGFRTHKNIWTEAFKLQAIAALEQGIVFPIGRFEQSERKSVSHNLISTSDGDTERL